MKSLTGQGEREPSPCVETYWVVDVFGQSDKVKRKSRRPPTYNPDDYAAFFRKILANNSNVGPVEKLYGKDAQLSAEMRSRGSRNPSPVLGNNRTNGANSSSSSRPPSDFSDVLKKLRLDLCFSFASFCKEFGGDTCDGISLLMDLLRAIQMAQAELNGSNKEIANVRANRRSLIRSASGDELESLLCLYQLCLANGHVPGKDHGCSRLLAHTAGYYGLALGLVSNLTRTRSLALQLMTALCKMPGGHSRVSEALTTLRLNMGESVRLKLLSGIVNSSASRVETLSNNRNANANNNANNSDANNTLETCLSFLVEGMAFLNAFVQSAPDLRHQVVIQWEVEEAALNIDALAQVAETTRSPLAVQLKHEIALWNENQINIALLLDRLTNVTSTNEALRKDLLNLRSRLLALESEKRRFAELESDMKKRCADLESELTTLRSTAATTTTASSLSIGIQTIDTGLDDGNRYANHDACVMQRNSSADGSKSTSHMSCDDEDYDIDDVIEELNNIVNSAESDMTNPSCSSRSTPEQHLVPRYLPRPPPRPDSKRSLLPGVQLDADLNGETSDFPTNATESVNDKHINDDHDDHDDVPAADNPVVSDSDAEGGPTEISRKKIARTFFGQSSNNDDDDDDNRSRIEQSEVGSESEWNVPRASSMLLLDRRRASSVGVDRGDEDEEIQPDILRAIPTRLFHKSWDVLEARSPMYADDMLVTASKSHQSDRSGREAAPMRSASRRRHASVDNLCAVPRESPVFIHPTVQHPNLRDAAMIYDQPRFVMTDHPPMPPVYRHPERFLDQVPRDGAAAAAHMSDLQIGDVFTFNGQFPGGGGGGNHHPAAHVRPASAMRKSKRSSGSDSPTSKSNSRNSFALSSLIPGFLKSSFAGSSSSRDAASKAARDDWEHAFHTDKTLVRDYRHQFHPPAMVRQGSDPIPKFDMPAPHPEFWPASFQALPYRNIPPQYANNNVEPNRNERGRSVPLPSPTQLARDIHMHINRISKLMDHPSGMY